MKSIFVMSGLVFLTFVIPVEFVLADGLVPCGRGGIGPGSEACNTCHIVQLGNTLVNWLIGIITVLFGVLVAVAGFGLVTSQGNPSALQSAKERFANALIGFVIVLASWLIVDTLMRGLVGQDGIVNGEVTGGLFWADLKCFGETETSAGAAGSGGSGGVAGDPSTSGGSSAEGCSTCTSLPPTIATNGNACNNSGAACLIHPDMLSRVQSMSSGFTNGWQVSEAFPPTVKHKSTCHSDATCIDVSWNHAQKGAGEPSAAEINAFINLAKTQNLVAEYEVSNPDYAKTLRDAGVKNVLVVSRVKPHFSVYMCDKTSNSACSRASD